MFLDHLVVERNVVVRATARAHFDSRARMLVHLTGDHIRYPVTPLHLALLLQRHELIPDAFQNRSELEFRILEETKQ